MSEDILSRVADAISEAEFAIGDLRGYVIVCSVKTIRDISYAANVPQIGATLYGIPVHALIGYPQDRIDIVHARDARRMMAEAVAAVMKWARK